MRAMKIRPIMADVRVVVGAPVAVGMTSVTNQIGVLLLLGKMSRGSRGGFIAKDGREVYA